MRARGAVALGLLSPQLGEVLPGPAQALSDSFFPCVAEARYCGVVCACAVCRSRCGQHDRGVQVLCGTLILWADGGRTGTPPTRGGSPVVVDRGLGSSPETKTYQKLVEVVRA